MELTLIDPVFLLLARTCEKSPIISAIIRSLRFKGKGRIVQQIRGSAVSREVIADCGGVLCRLDLRDDVQRELYFGVFERNEIRSCLRFVPKGGVCLDIGANNGAFALQFANKVGPNGTVHAFEADSAIYSRLQVNCQLNGFSDRLKCHLKAVSRKSGTLTFYKSDPSHSGWGSLSEFKDIAVIEEKVETISLDDFLGAENISHVDLLKVDVEAHEPEVLEGAVISLNQHLFSYILIEFNGPRLQQRGTNLDDFLKPMVEAGYKVLNPPPDKLAAILSGSIPYETVLMNFLLAAPEKSS